MTHRSSRLVPVRRDVQADLLHEGHDLAHPRLAQLVVRHPLEAVLELDAVALAVVGQAEPLEREDEHPVQRRLEPRLLGRVGRELLDPRAPVAQVEGLLLVDLGERALPGPERARPVHVGEQDEPGLVVERVGEHELAPGVERDVEGVRVLERGGIALVDQPVHVDAEIAEQPVADVGVRELVLDDRDRRAVVVQRRRVLGRPEVGRRADELGVGRHGEDAADPAQVLGGHVLQALDELALREVLADLVLGPGRELLDLRRGWRHWSPSPRPQVPTCDT